MTQHLATKLISALNDKKLMIRCAESCTAGLIMAELTSISGSSAVVDRGYVTYSNQAKEEMLGVRPLTLATYGAVSAETAFEMVQGTVLSDTSHLAGIAITGIAGPNGGTEDKPVGTVWIGTIMPGKDALVRHYHFTGDRDAVRAQSVSAALEQLLTLLNS